MSLHLSRGLLLTENAGQRLVLGPRAARPGQVLFDGLGSLLRYARDASYPVYILHQTVIVAIAFSVVGWHAGVAVKYVAILVAASAGTLLAYEYLVRRFNPVRFLFGMKPRARGSRPRDNARGSRERGRGVDAIDETS